MLENGLIERPQRNPFLSFVIIMVVVALGFAIVGPMIGFIFAIPFYEGSIVDLATDLQNPMDHPSLKLPLYIMQGFATLIGLIVAPAWFLTTEHRSVFNFFKNRKYEAVPVLITVFVVIIFMGVNSIFIEWNANFHFPEFAKGFEEWAKEREDLATELTKYLTKFESQYELIVAILIIAVLPAIGEEIVFRGIIQNQLMQGTKNAHLSIWIAAFIFSAIHFQFFGFVPRLLLGGLFGYLYYWSGNLWLAITAHFVNNGFSVLALYFYQQGTVDFDMDKMESVPPNVLMLSAVLTITSLYYFYKYFENRKPTPDYL
jgi:uncharacterized protein